MYTLFAATVSGLMMTRVAFLRFPHQWSLCVLLCTREYAVGFRFAWRKKRRRKDGGAFNSEENTSKEARNETIPE